MMVETGGVNDRNGELGRRNWVNGIAEHVEFEVKMGISKVGTCWKFRIWN